MTSENAPVTPSRSFSSPRIATTHSPMTGPPIHHGNCSFIDSSRAQSTKSVHVPPAR